MPHSILVVDDSASIRQMVSFTLKTSGYEIVEAVDGEAGLLKAKLRSVDLVITDQNMPKMTGLELVQQLRQLPAYRKTPMLVLTTESSDAMKSAGRAAGASGWLVKPVDPTQLIAVVKKVLGT